MKKLLTMLLFIAATSTGSVALADGHEAAEMPGAVVREWSIVPKEGMAQQFEEGIQKHVKWRAENGDPWTWSVYMQTIGDENGTYYIRSNGHHFSELGQFDEFQSGGGAGAHYAEHVAPYVESITSAIDEVQYDATHWPEDDGEYRMVELIEHDLMPGKAAEYRAAIKDIHKAAQAEDWGVYYATGSMIVGGDEWDSWVAIPHKTYATMAAPETSMSDMLAAHYKKRKGEAVMSQYRGAIRESRSSVLMWREDLSTPQ